MSVGAFEVWRSWAGTERPAVQAAERAPRRHSSGSFANVFLAVHRDTGAEVAIKSINRERIAVNKKHVDNLESEVAIMRRLEHPNIVRLYGIKVPQRCIAPSRCRCRRWRNVRGRNR